MKSRFPSISKITGAVLAVAASLLLPAGANAQVRGAEHVVIIGCDGMGSLAFTSSNAPVMHRMMRDGASTLKARGVMPTSSSPNWASMICGAGPEQHGVTSNDWETNKFEIAPICTNKWGLFPTIFGTLREQRPKSTIVCVHDWDGFARLFEQAAANYVTNIKSSPLTAAHAIKVIKERQPTFTFIHFDDVDHAGHTFGWKSWQYYQAVDMVDGLIGDILKTIDDTSMKGKTIVLITADHGGREKKHGGATQEEIDIPWIMTGPKVSKGHSIASPVNTYDTAATIAYIFGLKQPDCWLGKPVVEAFGRK